ncbi:MAG: ribosome maturation factor [Treponema sp.]|nr:ribosome maturation factor [Treponema sp.]
MDYTPYNKIKYYAECAPLVEGMGYKLVDLKIVPAKTVTKISAIITGTDPTQNIGVNDCAKVHRVLLTRLEALLGTEETTMELTSPGIEHNLKNAAEFSVFTGREVRVWDKTVNDWVSGTIKSADDKSVVLVKDGKDNKIAFENIAKAKFTYNK